ncbi:MULTISPECIES: DUF2262 domain-containing protein [Calothrix]|uniref:DUF2262 domain-containing protein n=2 Tax=Calothrix TaxID=1186 RepID=A0ABR8A8H7_9CYAN|nr:MULTISPECIES: DUF2262 domain-containing protein [Calothrix]MBD2196134.1 DUF2262 domain-containing protein [Calothrix parietina FACHB-288]MBD2224785.1 DUF2262 domain-containing protein [Calothrix anomala FACHB-343]
MTKKVIKNQILGELTWHNDFDWWKGKIEITPGNIISLSVDSENIEIPSVSELTCHSFTRIKQQEVNLRRCTANQLIDLYNKSWNNDDEIDCPTFMNLIKLEAVHLNSDGSATLYYEDGGLFGGHVIVVSIDCDGIFEDADIAG